MKHSNVIQMIVKCSGLFIVLNGLIVIFGWWTHDLSLIKLNAAFPPMHFNTALCFLICGYGLTTLYSNKINLKITAILLLLFVFLVVYEIIFQKTFLDNLFFIPFGKASIHPGRISSNSLLDFFFASIVFLLFSYKENKFQSIFIITAVLFSSLIVTFALVSLLEFITGISTTKVWGGVTLMSLHSAICFIILGVTLLIFAFSIAERLTFLFSIPIFFALLSSVFYISYSIKNYEDVRFAETVRNELNHAADEFSLYQTNLYRSLGHLSERWAAQKGTPQNWFEADAVSYLRDYPTLQALTIVDKTFHLIWVVPLEPNKRFIGLDYKKEPVRAMTMANAIAAHSAQTTPPIHLFANNAVGFLYMSPLYIDGQFDGLLLAGFNADISFNFLFKKTLLPNYYLVVREENTLIFSNLPDKKTAFNSDWTVSKNITVNNKVWGFSLTPKPGLLAAKNSYIPYIVFITGFITSLITALGIFFGMEAKRIADELYATIAKRKQVQAELKASKDWLQSIMNASHHAIIAVDTEGTIRLFNTAAEKMTGYTAKQMIGKHTPVLIHDPKEMEKRSAELSTLLGRKIVPSLETFTARLDFQDVDEQEWIYVRKDQSSFPVWLSVTAVRVGGEVKGFVGIAQDISERKALESLKNEFISIVSHELRTPITSIHGVIGLLLGGALGDFTDKAHNMLTIAQTNCERLIRLINDILDMEKIDAGKMEFNFEPLNLNKVAEETILTNQTYANNYKVFLKLDAWPRDIYVNADSDRLQQVFTNLLSNAIKFSPKNSTVTITTSFADGEAIISFRDCGSGIPDAFQKTIFQKFSQADPTSTRKKGGTGLGLSISKAIVEILKGKISFITKMNYGTTFIVTLPGWELKDETTTAQK